MGKDGLIKHGTWKFRLEMSGERIEMAKEAAT